MEVWDNCTSRDHDNSLGGVDLGRIRLLTGDAGQSPTETIRVQELSREWDPTRVIRDATVLVLH